MQVAIIKYNAGNIYSVDCALKRVGVDAVITDDEEVLKSSDKIIFPGVGEAASTMHYLRQKGLDKLIKSFTQPVLGICIGMQLMCRHSEEGDVDCLNIFDVDVKRFCPMKNEKIPHMGWNSLKLQNDGRLFKDLPEEPYVYFVHSYYLKATDESIVKATTEYSTHIHASVEQGNVFACQFHPEKSSDTGLQILKNFVEL